MRLHQTIRQRSSERHIHASAYASVVLHGGYEEAGDQGRLRVRAGDVIFHDRFEAHLNRFDHDGAVVLNLTIPDRRTVKSGLGRITDLDGIIRMANVDRRAGLDCLVEQVSRQEVRCHDWEDSLCASLRENPSLCLGSWAEASGLAPWVVSRGFKRVFGVTPEYYRARVRARIAWERIRKLHDCLASVAVDCGFSDQAHMTRGVKALTARTPAAWRTANGYKTESQSMY